MCLSMFINQLHPISLWNIPILISNSWIYPIYFSILNSRGSAVFILGEGGFRVPGCTTSRTQWITESIAFRSKLKSARRMRVREPLGASMFRMLGISLASSNEQNNHFMYFVLCCWYLYNSLPIIYIHTHYYTGYLPIQHASPTIFCI